MGFLSLRQAGATRVVVHGLLIAVASLVEGHRPSGVRVLVAVARGLRSCGLQALEHRLCSCGTECIESTVLDLMEIKETIFHFPKVSYLGF